MEQEKFDQWAIVELMGHRKLAGRVSERIIAGQPLLQIDVPEVSQNGTQLAGYTQFYGASSLYCLTPTTEEIARRYTLYHRERPVQSYELPQLKAAEPAVASDPVPFARPGENELEMDRCCEECGHTPQEAHAEHCSFAEVDDDGEP